MFLMIEGVAKCCWVVDTSKMKAWRTNGFTGTGQAYGPNVDEQRGNLKFALDEGPFKTFDTFEEADKAAKKFAGLPTLLCYKDLASGELFTGLYTSQIYVKTISSYNVVTNGSGCGEAFLANTPVQRVKATFEVINPAD